MCICTHIHGKILNKTVTNLYDSGQWIGKVDGEQDNDFHFIF